jgi:deoxyribonuclease-4
MTKHSTKIGAHVSIAGGVFNAPLRAQEEGCETFQCFTRSPQGGPAPELTDETVSLFRRNMEAAGMDRFVIHAPYYINLASLNGRILHSSIAVIRQELERGTVLGGQYVMFHPGSYKDQTPEEATAKVQNSLEQILEGYEGTCKLLIEISAGSGNVLGDTFTEVADMMKTIVGYSGFGGVCFDTCHAFASGYDFRTSEKAAGVLREFDKTIGLKWLKLTHVNDSKADLGGHKDRHEHIGLGHIGTAGLSALLKTEPFSHIDWILETPGEGRDADISALKNIRG